MGYAANQILAPLSILKVMSRINLPGTTLSQIFGWNVGNGPIPGALFSEGNSREGGNVTPRGNFEDSVLRESQYDIFDFTRKIATASVPGSPSTAIEPQKVGSVQFTIPRSAEEMPLLDEKIHNQRQIGATPTAVDRGGAKYIKMQEDYLAARFANLIEFQTAAMLRGKYYFSTDGNRLLHSFTSGDVTIDYKRPAGNLNQLNMLGAGNIISADWSTSSTKIVDHLYSINAAMTQLTGMGLAHVICSSKVWGAIQNNTQVHTLGGSANVVFNSLVKNGAGEFSAIVRSIPWVKFHIVDYVLDIETSGNTFTSTRLIGENDAVFIPEVNDTWAHYIRGCEYVTEGPNGTRSLRYGFYPWAYPSHNPSGWRLNAVLNGFPANPIPKAIAYGTVIGF